ncbi:MAG TPA: 16S rRNA (guanine(966)-N(2))-methyltransferase RsmD [Caulobacteraceae bacterium]|nr:16S rRNA (guanine(966)-N(2))-methyltransferase RsmD [Caulobacteraceae bacterium]
MRIIAGVLRGRSLVAPKGHSTRPTADSTRQAIFNVLEHAAFGRAPAGLKVADLFAGAGAMGLEALSRGALSCLFIDNDRAAVGAIEANLARLGLADRASARFGDARSLGQRSAFDLVFLDPPYGQGLAEEALAVLVRDARLAAGALAVVERGVREGPVTAPGFEIVDERRWGAARVAFLRRP